MKEMGNGNSEGEKAKVGTADFLVELENRRAIKVLFFRLSNQTDP